MYLIKLTIKIAEKCKMKKIINYDLFKDQSKRK